MAEFIEKEILLGFDRDAGWQMVPVGGARGVKLVNGKDLTVAISAIGGGDTDVATVNEVRLGGNAEREFWISGHHFGSAVLEARNSKTSLTEAKLQIAVLDKQELKVAFWRVKDIVGYTGSLGCSDAGKILKAADEMLSPQTNLHLRLVSCEDLITFNDWGDEINSTSTFPKLALLVSPMSADFHVFLVCEVKRWGLKFTGRVLSDPDAVTRGQFRLFQSAHGGLRQVALAHEVGHFLGLKHVDDADNLMNASNEGGQRLTKQQTLSMHKRMGAKVHT